MNYSSFSKGIVLNDKQQRGRGATSTFGDKSGPLPVLKNFQNESPVLKGLKIFFSVVACRT